MKILNKIAVISITIIVFANVSVLAQSITKYYYDNSWHEYKEEPIVLKVGGEKLSTDMPPIIFDNRSIVPARIVFEKLGAKVSWDQGRSEVELTTKDNVILLKINNKIAIVNGVKSAMDVPAKIVNNRTMIPVRFVAETLGMIVNWDEKHRQISIDNSIQEVVKKDDIRVTKVDYEVDSKGVNIIIKADSEIDKYSSFELEENSRVVVDISDAILSDQSKVADIGVRNVIKVRYAQNQLSPAITRVVIELNELEYYRINLSKDKKCLTIGFVGDYKNNGDPNKKDEATSGTIIDESDESIKIDIDDKRDDITIDTRAKEKIVVIDAGHGGKDPGAVVGTLFEKDLNLDITLRLYKLLKANNVKVHLTRKNDVFVELRDRAEIANIAEADLFVSVHNNAMSDPVYEGSMMLYYPSQYDTSYGLTGERFAEIMQEELVNKLKTKDLGLRERPMLVVLNKTKMPSVIVEVGFMTNEADRIKLKQETFRQKSAEALFAGIIKSLNESVK